MKSMRHLVLGAARSGKTRFALNLAKSLAHANESEVIYVATAEARDVEMRERIARHRAERPATWRTLEAPSDLASALAAIGAAASNEHAGCEHASCEHASCERAGSEREPNERSASSSASREHSPPLIPSSVIIIDCLTLWLSNALLRDFNETQPTAPLPAWARERDSFLSWLNSCPHAVILVSNEVGGGIVPTSALARRFQSEQGWLNQDVARISEHVTLVVAGLPMTVKAPAGH